MAITHGDATILQAKMVLNGHCTHQKDKKREN